MGFKFNRRLNSSILAVVGFFLILTFQNCSDLDNTSAITLTDVERSALLDLPFAYDMKIDQMAYMSCSGLYASQDARSFTIKAGGYFPGSGVGLRSNYLSQIQNFNADARARSLGISTRNDQAGVVMSLRSRSNFQDYLDPASQSGEIPIAKMMFDEAQGLLLSNERVAKQLIALGAGGNYLNYAAGLPGLFNKSFDGVLRIANDSVTEDQLRSILKNSHYITLGYAEPLGLQPSSKPYSYLRSPYDTLSGDTRAKTSIFGTGYVANFQQFDPVMTTSPPRVMTISNAVNLENNSFQSEQWDCSERFVVVRPEDASRLTFDLTPANPNDTVFAQVCDTRSDDVPLNSLEQLRWDRIRNILPVEDWYVNLPSAPSGVSKPGCIVPKSSDFCYDMSELNPNGNPNVKIAYYSGEDLDDTTLGITYNKTCGPGTMFACPHIVTICYKK